MEKEYDLEKDFLPVGSVVSIRFNENKFMIIGFCTVESTSHKIYDYSAVLYPSGFENLESIIMFNKDIIKKVYHYGYITEEEKDFKVKLNEAIENNNYKKYE